MINIEKAKKELINHINQTEVESPRVQIKTGHIIRVAGNCKKIAEKLELTQEQIELAELTRVIAWYRQIWTI